MLKTAKKEIFLIAIWCVLLVMQAKYVQANNYEWKTIPYETKILSNKVFYETLHKPRPANLFKLAYSANDQVCKKILAQMNEGGVDQDNSYISRWWLANKYMPTWNFVIGELDKAPRVEFAEVDIDGDGLTEAVYRDVSMISSMVTSEISIFDKPLPIEKHYFMNSSNQKNNEKFKEASKLLYENPKVGGGWGINFSAVKQKVIDDKFDGKRPTGLQALWGGSMVDEVILVDSVGYLMEISYQPAFEYFNILVYQPVRSGEVQFVCGLAPKVWLMLDDK